MLVFCLSSFGGLASCREKKKETESDSSKWSCRKVMFCLFFSPLSLFILFRLDSDTLCRFWQRMGIVQFAHDLAL
jgi:hypothetical protein